MKLWATTTWWALRAAAFACGLGIAMPAWAALQSNSYPASGPTLSCSGRPYIDVLCYPGADPTGVGDSTTAINSAVSDAIVNGGFPVHFPKGTFKVSSALVWDYQGIAAAGLEIISDGAIIDGRTIPSGSVLQIQCSGGTPAAPAACSSLRIQGTLTVQGNTPAYVVAVGKPDFSDVHGGVRLDHLIATNASTGGSAGGIQLNYISGRDIWVSGTTAGGSASVGAVALEQVQNSRIAGAASAAGASAPGMLIENGASSGNMVAGFTFSAANATCVSITSNSAKNNGFFSVTLPCTTAVNAPQNAAASGNLFYGPNFTGTNQGPLSTGVGIVGRGSLNRFQAPATTSYTAQGADDGTIFSSASATGSPTQFMAASLPVALPAPSAVGAGWSIAFVTDNNKAVVVTAPGNAKIISGGVQVPSMTLGSGNYEVAALQSDGSNFRLLYATPRTLLYNGLTNGTPTNWQFLPGPGYQATQGDNGSILSSGLTQSGLAVTLPSTTAIVPGWTIGLATDNGRPLSIQTNATAGGSIQVPGAANLSSYSLANTNQHLPVTLQFDGANFRVLLSNGVGVSAPGTVADGVTDNCAAANAIINGTPAGAPIMLRFSEPGTYIFNCTLSTANHSVKIVGAGKTATILKFVSGGDGFDINYSTGQMVEFADLTVATTGGATGTGLSIVFTWPGNFSGRDIRHVILNHLSVKGFTQATQSWNTGILLTDVDSANIDDIDILGINGIAGTTADSQAANTVTPFGLVIAGINFPTDIKITNSRFWSLANGVFANNTTLQGLQVLQSTFVLNGVAISWATGSANQGQPQLSAIGNNFNVYSNAIVLSGTQQNFITGNLIYHNESATSAAQLIQLTDVGPSLVADNEFEQTGVSANPVTNGILVTSGTYKTPPFGEIIRHNSFGLDSSSFNTGIDIEGAVTSPYLKDNRFSATVVTPVKDQNTGGLGTQTIYGLRYLFVKLSNPVTIPSGVDTAIPWDTVVYQTEGWFWSSTSGGQLRVSNSGGVLGGADFRRARCTAHVQWQSNATGTRVAKIQYDNADFVTGQPLSVAPALGGGIGQDQDAGGMAPTFVTGSDWFSLVVNQSSGASLQVSAQHTWMECEGIE